MENMLLGQEQLRAGNVRSAENIAARALAVDPLDAEALELRFDCLMFRNDYKVAKKHAEDWLLLDAGVMRAHECFMQAGLHLKDKAGCLKALQTMKDAFPRHVLQIKLYEALCDAHFSNGKKARILFKELAEEYPDMHALVKLQADNAFQQDQMFKAYRLYREAIQMDPTHAWTWRMYAVNAFHTMRYGEARKAARKALEFDPTMVEMKAIINLSWIVYFPIFYLASLFGSTYFFVSEFFGKFAGYVLGALLGYFVYGTLLVKGIRYLSSIGIDVPFWFLGGGILLWLVIEHGTFHWIDNKKNKVKDVKLSDY